MGSLCESEKPYKPYNFCFKIITFFGKRFIEAVFL